MANLGTAYVSVDIGVRENLTDPRFVEFIEEKNWDISKEE